MALGLCLPQAHAAGDYDAQLESLVQECNRQPHRDRICDGIITMKIIGEDSIEAVKEFINLGTYEYYLLTAANFVLTGRLRFKVPVGKISLTVDYRKDNFQLVGAMTF